MWCVQVVAAIDAKYSWLYVCVTKCTNKNIIWELIHKPFDVLLKRVSCSDNNMLKQQLIYYRIIITIWSGGRCPLAADSIDCFTSFCVNPHILVASLGVLLVHQRVEPGAHDQKSVSDFVLGIIFLVLVNVVYICLLHHRMVIFVQSLTS